MGYVRIVNRISLRNKLVISFILILLPMFILSFLSIGMYSSEIENKLINSAIGNNEQIINNIDNSLNMLAKLSEYPLYDENLIEILKRDYDGLPNARHVKSNDFEKANDLLNYNIVFYSNMLDSVWLYGYKYFDLRGRALVERMRSDYSITSEEWLDRIISADGASVIIGIHYDNQKLPGRNLVISVGRLIKDTLTRERIGIILINVDVHSLEKLWMDRGVTPNTLFYLTDESGRIIFSKNKEHINLTLDSVFGESVNFNVRPSQEIMLEGNKYQLISSQSSISGWRAISIIPTNELFSYNIKMYKIMLLIGLGVVILSIAAVYLITTSITRPIYALSNNMRKMGEGNFDVPIGNYYGEMGVIGQAISMMQTKIKNLIEKIYLEEEEKRRAELHALQAQINPHFLYNTMSAIKWMANIQGATSIENALNSLAYMMAYTSKWNNDFVSIADEMIFIENYISILELRYYNKFKVHYDIEPEVRNYKTLKFLLQPMIENAVFHGFEGLEEMGELHISIKKENDEVVFKVKDNGQGFDTKRLKHILEEDKDTTRQRFNSIGLSNVHKRIKLHFGEKYGLDIKSTLLKGTEVTIVIPAIPNNTDNKGGIYETANR